LQLADSSLSAVSAAFSGALVALAAQGRLSYGSSLSTAYVLLAVVALVATVRARQLRPPAHRAVTDEPPGADPMVCSPVEAAVPRAVSS
jgi:hypothetical protein